MADEKREFVEMYAKILGHLDECAICEDRFASVLQCMIEARELRLSPLLPKQLGCPKCGSTKVGVTKNIAEATVYCCGDCGNEWPYEESGVHD